MVTSGAVEAIVLVLEAIIAPGTRVVLENPIDGSYAPLLHLLGAEVTPYELSATNSYEYDFERLEALVRDSRAEFVSSEPVQQPDRSRARECLLARRPSRAERSYRLQGGVRRGLPPCDP